MIQFKILVLSLVVWTSECLDVFVTNHSTRTPHSVINKDGMLFKFLKVENEPFIDIEESWNIKPCLKDNEFKVSPHLSLMVYCKKSPITNRLESKLVRCPKGEIVNTQLQKCQKLQGNGFASCYIPDADCPGKLKGTVTAHPHKAFYMSYLICLAQGGVVVADCEVGQHFDQTTKQCEPLVPTQTVLVESACKEADPIKCTTPGIFTMEYPLHKKHNIPPECRDCLYFCSIHNETTFELTIQCPRIYVNTAIIGPAVQDITPTTPTTPQTSTPTPFTPTPNITTTTPTSTPETSTPTPFTPTPEITPTTPTSTTETTTPTPFTPTPNITTTTPTSTTTPFTPTPNITTTTPTSTTTPFTPTPEITPTTPTSTTDTTTPTPFTPTPNITTTTPTSTTTPFTPTPNITTTTPTSTTPFTPTPEITPTTPTSTTDTTTPTPFTPTPNITTTTPTSTTTPFTPTPNITTTTPTSTTTPFTPTPEITPTTPTSTTDTTTPTPFTPTPNITTTTPTSTTTPFTPTPNITTTTPTSTTTPFTPTPEITPTTPTSTTETTTPTPFTPTPNITTTTPTSTTTPFTPTPNITTTTPTSTTTPFTPTPEITPTTPTSTTDTTTPTPFTPTPNITTTTPTSTTETTTPTPSASPSPGVARDPGECDSFLNLTCPSVGSFRYQDSCTEHYQCVESKACGKIAAVATFSCPRCLKFNAEQMKCDLPQNVPECTYLDASKGFQHTKYEQRKYCTGEGKYVVPEDCSFYYDCTPQPENNNTFSLSIRKCPGSRKFNDKTKRCERDCKCPQLFSDCEDGGPSYDKFSCEKFYYCEGNKRVVLYCPEGYLFAGRSCVHQSHNCVEHCNAAV